MEHLTPLERSERDVAHLEIALSHRTVIGQATGLLMERHDLDADAAFAVLARTSQETNRKLYVLAQELVADRARRRDRPTALPGPGATGPA